MAVLSIKSFGGISPKVPPRYLKDTQAQIALNCPVFSGALVPIRDVGAAVHTVTKLTAPKTIYRFGQDLDSDSQYWFNWPKDVDVCRSQIAGDKSEWTFFTGDGPPRATYNTIATSGPTLPFVVRPLGLPNPTSPLNLTREDFQPDTYPASLVLVPEIIANMAGDYIQQTRDYGIQVSITDQQDASFTQAAVAEPVTAQTVADAINTITGVTAVEEKGAVRITTVAEGPAVKLYVRARTGSRPDYEADFIPDPIGFDKTGNGSVDSLPVLVIPDSEIAEIGKNGVSSTIKVYSDGIQRYYVVLNVAATAASIAAQINAAGTNAGAIIASDVGGNLYIVGGNTANIYSGTLKYERIWLVFTDYGDASSYDPKKVEYESAGSDADIGGSVSISQPELTALRGKVVVVDINGETFIFTIPGNAVLADMVEPFALNGIKVNIYGTTNQVAVLESIAVGPDTQIRFRSGTYPYVGVFAMGEAFGYDETPTSTETRVYTWTWVNKESGFEFESGPSAASASTEAYPEQAVTVSGRAAVPTGYNVTHWRLYRSVAGVYLFVAEIPVEEVSYTDKIEAELLAEELSTLTWSPPPADLAGLTNLPNGIMAGFVGRDVHFCDPYHPHAWPQNYVQSLDYPVVGLGRMDTTLAVLTSGTPYFIQGSHPDSMTAVRSDLEQACASKRSIVSTNGVVMYASPDGLVLLSPSGSRLITENLFTRAQWQTYFRPESINAYSHDMKYIGFYDNGVTQGGFIFDPTSGQFILHDIYVGAGYSDLRRDKLFVSFSDRTIKEWLAGANKNYIWKSKKFTLPNVLSMSCAQVEAEAYPVTAKFYVDGALVHTQTVADRNPFRLPATPGRDLEVQFEGSSDIFAFSIAQSMQELAGV